MPFPALDSEGRLRQQAGSLNCASLTSGQYGTIIMISASDMGAKATRPFVFHEPYLQEPRI